MRGWIRSCTPEVLLRIYRPLRNLSRNLFRGIHDHHNSNRLKKQVIDRFADLAHPSTGGLVLDLGANVGDFTSACLDLGFTVIAVEPHPNALRYLQKRMRRNQNVEIVPYGVSDVDGKTHLYTHPDHLHDPITTSISASTVSDKFQEKGNSIEIDVVSIDHLLNQGSVFEIVKIDIEGAEMLLIESLIKHSAKINRLLLETHERFMSNTVDAKRYQDSITKLKKFIKSNNLEKDWLTDWL